MLQWRKHLELNCPLCTRAWRMYWIQAWFENLLWNFPNQFKHNLMSNSESLLCVSVHLISMFTLLCRTTVWLCCFHYFVTSAFIAEVMKWMKPLEWKLSCSFWLAAWKKPNMRLWQARCCRVTHHHIISACTNYANVFTDNKDHINLVWPWRNKYNEL